MDLSKFPADITTKILSFLPVKSVFRSRSVSKTWCSLLDKPEFVNMHIYSSSETDDPSSLIIIPYQNHDDEFTIVEEEIGRKGNPILRASCIYLTCTDDSPFAKDLPAADSPDEELFAVGSSRGLVCSSSVNDAMSVGSYCRIFISNPVTCEYVMLPYLKCPRLVERASFVDVASGFGFDSSTNKFKVVKVFGSLRHELEVRVFTLGGSNAWRKVVGHGNLRNDFDVDSGIRRGSLVNVNGSLHWISYAFNLAHLDAQNPQSPPRAPVRIVAFDLEQENFRIIPNPPLGNVPKNVTYPKFELGVLRGCLCLSDCFYQKDCYEIWAMKEYDVKESWRKQYVIRKAILLPHIYIEEVVPVSLRKNGDVVLLCDSKFLVSYNPQSRKATLLKEDGLPEYEP